MESELYWTNGRQLTVVGNLLNSDVQIKKSIAIILADRLTNVQVRLKETLAMQPEYTFLSKLQAKA